jgi:hypothetical protein
MKPYLIITLFGGMGNQMFQYAFALSYHRRTGLPVYIDNSILNTAQTHRNYELDVYPLSLPLGDSLPYLNWAFFPKNLLQRGGRYLLRKCGLIKFIDDCNAAYDYSPKYFRPISVPTYWSGYYQAAAYYLNADLQCLLRREFAPVPPLSAESANILQQIRRHPDSVSLHIRRGDYLKYAHLFCILGSEYYQAAVRFLQAFLLTDIHIFVFSEDAQYADELLSDIPYTIVPNHAGKRSFEDVYLMSQCTHNIIANSTYSWWGAYLNAHPQKVVIAPKQWLTQNREVKICCPDWVTL